MTVSNETNRNAYTATSSQTVFVYGFRILDESHLAVYQNDVLLTLTTHYTVSNVGVSTGGNVTLVTGATTDDSIVILRDVPKTQEIDYIENDPFPAQSHEDAIDQLTMAIQELDEKIDRSIILDPSSSLTGVTFPTPSPLGYIVWNLAGDGFDNVSSLSAGNSVFNEAGDDVDLRMESDTNTHMFFMDGGNNKIGINKSVPNTTLHVGGDFQTDGTTVIGDPGTEDGGVPVNGATYDALLKVSDLGGSEPAQFVLHRHSTTLQAIMLGTRAKTDDDTHAVLTNSDAIFSIIAGYWTGTHYDLAGSIDFGVPASGTVSSTSSPGDIYFKTTPSGSQVPVSRLSIKSDGRIGVNTDAPNYNVDVQADYSANSLNAGINIDFDQTTGGGSGSLVTGLHVNGNVSGGTYDHVIGTLVWLKDMTDATSIQANPAWYGVEGRVDFDADSSGGLAVALGVLGVANFDNATDNTQTYLYGVEGRVGVGDHVGVATNEGIATGGLFHVEAGAVRYDAQFGKGDATGLNNKTIWVGYNTVGTTSAQGFALVHDANNEFQLGTDDTTLTGGVALMLPEASGASSFKIRDSAGAVVWGIDSDGYNTTTQVAVGTFTKVGSDASTGGTPQSVNVGFKPSFVHIEMSDDTSFVEGSTGFTDGTTTAGVVRNGGANYSITNLVQFDDATAGTDTQVGTLNAFTATGFDIDWVKTGSPAGDNLVCKWYARK